MEPIQDLDENFSVSTLGAQRSSVRLCPDTHSAERLNSEDRFANSLRRFFSKLKTVRKEGKVLQKLNREEIEGSPSDWYEDQTEPAKALHPSHHDFPREELNRKRHQFSDRDELAAEKSLSEVRKMLGMRPRD